MRYKLSSYTTAQDTFFHLLSLLWSLCLCLRLRLCLCLSQSLCLPLSLSLLSLCLPLSLSLFLSLPPSLSLSLSLFLSFPLSLSLFLSLSLSLSFPLSLSFSLSTSPSLSLSLFSLPHSLSLFPIFPCLLCLTYIYTVLGKSFICIHSYCTLETFSLGSCKANSNVIRSIILSAFLLRECFFSVCKSCCLPIAIKEIYIYIIHRLCKLVFLKTFVSTCLH